MIFRLLEKIGIRYWKVGIQTNHLGNKMVTIVNRAKDLDLLYKLNKKGEMKIRWMYPTLKKSINKIKQQDNFISLF